MFSFALEQFSMGSLPYKRGDIELLEKKKENKCSAVAEMGDRFATIDMG